MYKETIREVHSIESKITEMHEELVKDIKIVNPSRILQFNEGNMEAKVLTKSFNEAVEKIRDNESPSAYNFTTLASIESMLSLNKNSMP